MSLKNTKKLLETMAKLRDKETGCSWDIQQTPETIVPYMLLEAYEVADAIENGNIKDIKSEIGDLLYQVVYFSQMYKEQNLFDFEDVAKTVDDKMKHRYGPILSDKKLSIDEVNILWEQQKKKERAGEPEADSILDNIPMNMPAMTIANKLTQKVSKVGFDWDTDIDVISSIKSELQEVEDELTKETREQDKIFEEIGDLLFASINIARKSNIDPEQALRAANQKFINRFHHIEKRAKETNISLKNMSLNQMESYWKEAKNLQNK